MWDQKYDLDYITERLEFSKLFPKMLHIICNTRYFINFYGKG